MKLPSSCSTASPSPYHLNSDAAAAGCFSGILRRLVCGTLDVGSSSRNRVADAGTAGAVLGAAEAPEKAGSLKPPATPPSAPGIVARLMGLDSMPELPSAPQGPIGRSRSTGSLEGWPVLLPVQTHRRSHSFRETPTFLRPENDEFLLLSFSPENGEETKKSPEPPPKSANHEMGLRQLDQRNAGEKETQERPSQIERAAERTPTKKKKKKKNVQREIAREKAAAETCRRYVLPPHKAEAHIKTRSRGTGPAKTATHIETPERTRPTKTGDEEKTSVISKTMAELECSSQNSSPVSVLDRLPELDGESFTDTSTPISDGEEEPRQEESSRRKLSSQLDCFDDPSQFFHLILVEDKQRSMPTEKRRAGTRDAASLPHSSSHLWAEACRLAEGDAQRQPWKTQDPEEIVVEFGLQILESLLQETVDEFFHVPAAAAPELMCMTT
ncbi:hypothetical protein Taro_038535 [Colocasia esculenta]|uniref:DUF3741 domain-containing protein n=1 Tax=Colocasia esculenta TaxID=4460 RepID=A0A843W3R7_COLES|nr:hypothetical protein [Colocasia esculenta]